MKRRISILAVAGATAVAFAAIGSSSASAVSTSASATKKPTKQCSTSLKVLRPHYTNPVPKLAGGSDSLSGAGSTFVNPIMSIWSSTFAKQGTKVAYQSIGSGGGIAQIQAQTVDFGATDIALSDTEAAVAKGGPILHVPMVLGAVVAVYNVKGLANGLRLDGETLGKIYAGQITKWNDPAIKAQNSQFALPDQSIAVAHRSDGSGTSAIFTDYLTKTSPSWVSKLGGEATSRGKTVAWPVGIGGKGNEGVAAVVSQTEGAIGYVELQYAIAQKLTYAFIKNSTGAYIEPCVATVRAAVDKGVFPADLRTTVTNEPGPLAYPITGTVYALIYQNQTDEGKAKAIVNYFSWMLTIGQNFPASINYAPMGSLLQQKALLQLGKIQFGGKPVVKFTIPKAKKK